MTEAAPVLDDAEIRLQLAKMQDTRLESLGKDSLAWLAMIPEWTEPLAAEAGFPTGSLSLPEFITAAVNAGVARAWTGYGASGRPARAFAVRESERQALVERWNTSPSGRAPLAAAIGDTILGISAKKPELVPAGLRNWAMLATAARSDPGAAGRELSDQVEAEIEDGRPSDALDWVHAGEALVPALGPVVRSAAVRARRRVALAYRQQTDDVHLEHYQPRPEYESEVVDLLDSEDGDWALHLIGMGGVGKTMLVRYITSGRFAREHRPNLVCARVDFDHLSPAYPLRRPGDLLLELSEDLVTAGTTDEHDRLYSRFLDSVERLHEVRGDAALDDDPIEALNRPEAQEACVTFGRWLCGFGAPVLLILDTCEELAKLHLAGDRVPAVEATFEILDQVMRTVADQPGHSTVRVLFAGRRVLASSWNGGEADLNAVPRSIANTPHRPSLRVREMRGFLEQDARLYLASRGLSEDGGRVELILAASPELDRVSGLATDEQPNSDDVRYNPYDLDLYSDWIEEEPDLDATALAPGATGYVEARIIHRLRDAQLTRALPAVSLLGQWTEEMLTIAVPPTDAKGRRLTDKLLEQEWVDVVGRDSRNAMVLGVRPAALRRLRAYYDTGDHMGEREAARDLLAPGLVALIEAGPVDTLAEEAVLAAADVLDLEQVARLWSNIEIAVAREGAWLWVQRVAERLLGLAEEGRDPSGAPDPRRGLWAAVRATALAATGQVTPGVITPGSWDLVESDALAHPDKEAAWSLRQRAQLGKVAAGSPLDTLVAGILRDELDDPPVHVDSAAMAVLEAILEGLALEGSGAVVRAADVGRWAAAWDRRAVTGDAGARAFLHCMHGRLLASEDDTDAAAAFARAETLAATAPPIAGMLHWKPPDSVRSRVRAEWLRWRAATSTADAVPSGWLDDALADATTDGRCLAALVVTTNLDRGDIELIPDTLPVRYEEWRPRCALHDAVGPLPVVAARVALARGSATTADAILAETARNAYSTRVADAYTRAVLRARLELARFLRSREYGALVRAIGPDTDDDVTTARWMLTRLVDPMFGSGIPSEPDPTWTPAVMHGWLRAQCVWTGVHGQDVDAVDTGSDLVARSQLTLDGVELALVGVRPQPDDTFLHRDMAAVAVRRIQGTPPLLVHRVAAESLAVRAWILDITSADPLATLPRHLVAEHAFAEGEALALRLPRKAADLLRFAGHEFAATGDMAGAFVAILRATIAFIHAGDTERAAVMLDEARAPYEELRATEPSLPPWDDVPTAAHPVDGVWSPWLTRLECCQAGLRSSGPDGPKEASKIALPVELDVTLRARGPEDDTPVVPVTPTATSASDSTAPPSRRSEIPEIVLAIFFLFGIGAAASFLVRWLLGLVNAGDPGFWGGIGVAAAVGLGIGLIVQWIRRAVRSAGYLVGLEIAVVPAEVAGSGTVTWSARGRDMFARAILRIVRLVGRVHEPPPAVVTPRSRDAPKPARRRVPLRVAGRMRIPADMAGLPWEAAVLKLLVPGALRLPGRCALYRGLPDAVVSASRKPLVWPKTLSVLIDGDPSWVSVIEDEWTLVDAESASDPSAVRVVHLVGEPIRTSGGWQLRTEPMGDAHANVAQSVQSTRPQFVEAGDPRLLSGALVVIQVTPAGDEVRPDAEQGDALRSFCNEVVLSGAPAVIAIPSLPAEVAQEAVAALARTVAKLRRPRRVDGILDAVDAIRLAVAPREMKSDASRVEAAFDVCLFSSIDL